MNLLNSRNLKALLVFLLFVTVSFTLGPISSAQSKTEPYPISFSKSAGEDHTCAVTNEHKVRCWLWNDDFGGGIGYPWNLSQLSNVSKIAMGNVDCLVRLDTSVDCFVGQLPNPAGMSAAKDISVDGDVVCILNTNRNLFCWNLADTHDGKPVYWQTLETPVQLNEVEDFSVAGGGLCVVVTGKMSCWSSAFDAKKRQPMYYVPDSLSSIRDVEMSSDIVCAITQDNVAECWTKYSDLDVKAPAAVKTTKTLVVHRDTVCAISASSVLMCWGNTRDEFRISPEVTGVKNMSLDDHSACLVFQDNKSWCKNSRWQVDGNRISFDSSVKSEVATGSEVLLSGIVRVSQFAVPKTAFVRSKKAQNSNWSSWKAIPIQTDEGYIFTYPGRFSFKQKIDLTTNFQVKVFESEVKGVLPKTASFTVQAIPKTRKFTYTVKRNYINNFLQGATVSYSIKTDPRYQGACTASAETNRALNFALTDLGKYKTSSYYTVVNGVCSGKINIRYNGEYKITVVAVSKSFASLSNQTKILLKASG